jgi:hypothetical protein
MKGKYVKVIVVIVLAGVITVLFFAFYPKVKTRSAARNEVVDLSFPLDKKFEFGDYYFDISNGEGAGYPLCFCLAEKNSFPPDCKGDIKYIYRNSPGTMCVPLHIGNGRCSSKMISSSSFATMFTIPLEYGWTEPFETIVMGIRVPETAPVGAKLAVELTIYKSGDRAQLIPYRKYTQVIHVK